MSEQDIQCPSCRGTIPAGRLICYYCGSSSRPLTTVDEQRQGLAELHHALAAASKRTERRDSVAESPAEEEVRGRILRNAFIPDDGELLYEEALRCDEIVIESTSSVATSRRDRCVEKLDLVSRDDAALRKKLFALRERIESRRRASDRETRNALFGCSIALSIVIAIVWLMSARSCG